MSKILRVILITFLVSMVLSACNSSDKVTVDIDMKEYTFDPDTIEVPANAEVTLKLSNSGTLEHEMVIMVLGKEASMPFDADDEPNIYWEHELEMASSETVVFTAPNEPGEYQIVCGVPAHLELGMKGTLIVK